MHSINRLGYKILKSHKFCNGLYIVLAQMELPTTRLVAICDEENILESQVFVCNDKGANSAYKSQYNQMYSKKNN